MLLSLLPHTPLFPFGPSSHTLFIFGPQSHSLLYWFFLHLHSNFLHFHSKCVLPFCPSKQSHTNGHLFFPITYLSHLDQFTHYTPSFPITSYIIQTCSMTFFYFLLIEIKKDNSFLDFLDLNVLFVFLIENNMKLRRFILQFLNKEH